jgi:hypothetical protein
MDAAMKLAELSRRVAAIDSIWEPPADATLAPAVPEPVIAFEEELIDVIVRPLVPGETAFVGHRRREAEILAVLDQLTELEAHFLHRRLANPRPGDRVAAALARLTSDRRGRVIAYVADTRRRNAQRAARLRGAM